jgi:hypothetical protein
MSLLRVTDAPSVNAAYNAGAAEKVLWKGERARRLARAGRVRLVIASRPAARMCAAAQAKVGLRSNPFV